MPHWPKPWGRAAGAVEQLVIEEEFAAAGIKRPDFGITGWVILTLIQHGTPDQIERFVRPALSGDRGVVPVVLRADAGSDAAGIKTRSEPGRRWMEGQRAEGVDQRGAVAASAAWPPCGPTRRRPSTRASLP